MADCRRDGRLNCHPNAAKGCVHWMRETGVDDDDWSPAPLNRPWSPEAQPMPMTPARYSVIQEIQAEVDRKAAVRAQALQAR